MEGVKRGAHPSSLCHWAEAGGSFFHGLMAVIRATDLTVLWFRNKEMCFSFYICFVLNILPEKWPILMLHLSFLFVFLLSLLFLLPTREPLVCWDESRASSATSTLFPVNRGHQNHNFIIFPQIDKDPNWESCKLLWQQLGGHPHTYPKPSFTSLEVENFNKFSKSAKSSLLAWAKEY